MNKIILITGASGFIGKHVFNEFKKRGFKIRLAGRSLGLEQFKNEDCVESIIETDNLFLNETKWWIRVFHNIDIIVHLAWYAEPGKYLNSDLNLECLIGTINMAKAASKTSVKRFVGIGTCFEYDLETKSNLTVSSPIKPKTIYAATKVATYSVLSEFFMKNNIDFLWERVFFLYGEGEDDRKLVAYIRKKINQNMIVELSSGDQVRDYLDVEEAAKLIVDDALGSEVGPKNVCSGKGVTVRELAEKIANEYGRIDLLKFGLIKTNVNDPDYVVGKR